MPDKYSGLQRVTLHAPVAVALAILFLSGCATTQNVKQIDRLRSVGEHPKILLMPPDIRYYLVTAGGVPEPNAQWTKAAQENFVAAVNKYAAAHSTDIKILDEHNLSPRQIQYEQLHAAVGQTVLRHYFGIFKLPSKDNRFDWTLGPEIRKIGQQHDADYAMFVFYRDYQASGGRIAFAILAAVAGVATNTGSEGGFASLVDLKTGDIVWFNVVNVGAGELRDAQGAVTAINTLFKDMPTKEEP